MENNEDEEKKEPRILHNLDSDESNTNDGEHVNEISVSDSLSIYSEEWK